MNLSLDVSLTKGSFPTISKEKSTTSYKPRTTDLEQLQNTNRVTVNNNDIEETLAGIENIKGGTIYH